MLATIDADGAILIPRTVCEEAGFAPGAEVYVVTTPRGLKVVKADPVLKEMMSVVGSKQSELAGKSTEEWVAELRGRPGSATAAVREDAIG